ncbi:MAG: GAF domain-containing protein, partial [Acidiferrobacterales bacterium]
ELEARNRDITESLEQQTATSEVLRTISGSPTDVQPVFDMIARSAKRLCNGEFSGVFQFDGELIHLVGHDGLTPEGVEVYNQTFPRPPRQDSAIGRAISSRAIAQIEDVQADPDYGLTSLAQAGTMRCIIGVPMLREGKPIGGIVVWRSVPELFSDKQIELLKTFADQAVIAIANVRLFQELEARNRDVTESLEQQTATSEVLRVISSSPTDTQPVFDMIAESAAHLCSASDAHIFQTSGDKLRLVAKHEGPIPIWSIGDERPINRNWVTGRAIVDRQTIHIEDLSTAETEFPEGAAYARQYGHKTTLATPLLREGTPIGAILIRSQEVRPFTPKQIELLKTFADQAVIAIENVRLFQELTRSLEELKTLGEVGQAVSATLDLQTVLTTIVTHAVELTKTDAGTIYEFDEAEQVFIPQANYGLDEDVIDSLRKSRVRVGDSSAVGRAAMAQTPVQIPDLANEPDYSLPFLHRAGFRALLAVPLLREGRIIGGLVVRRKAAGEFPQEMLNLLQTFATHSVLAIQNARFFREIEDKGQQLEVASQHKSQFLANMSHELRTPLNAIIGYSEMLQEEAEELGQDGFLPDLKNIHVAGKHLLQLINEILDLSKIEAGKMELFLERFDVPTLI